MISHDYLHLHQEDDQSLILTPTILIYQYHRIDHQVEDYQYIILLTFNNNP